MTAREQVDPPSPRRRRASRGSGEQLRPQIVAAAKQLLATSADAGAVSIRAVADAVGVTPPSIYLHFEDKSALLDAVVADVFAELDVVMLAAGDGIEDPLERLRAYGLAYVEFAVRHPEHYRIATMAPAPAAEGSVDDVLRTSAFDHFSGTVVACIEAGIFVGDDPRPITLDLWAAAHGIASLMVAKPYLPWGPSGQAADRALCAAALGHAVQGIIGENPEPAQISSWLDRERRAAKRRGGR